MGSAIALPLLLGVLAGPPFDYSSRYLTMRDGVRIAIDVYLPTGLAKGAKVPTVLQQTRYFRSGRVAFPASLFWPGQIEPRIARYTARGYAYVVVDVRGSGASFGTRKQEWSPDEIRDGAEIADWIVAQPWSNGKIGTTGVSYDGTAAEFALANRHPAIIAAAPRSGVYDAYDVAFPGGVKQGPFIAFWSKMTAAMDSNHLNSVLTGIGKVAYRGVKPVQGDTDERLLDSAKAQHAHNYNVAAGIGRNEFSDHTGQVNAMSPFSRLADIRASGAAIYGFAGWYDAGLQKAAIKRFLTVGTPGSRLILGPWSHAGENLSPFASSLTDFDAHAEVMRFFDHYLKGEPNGIDREPAVRYYTVGEERWKTSPVWPPAGAVANTLYLGADHSLSASPRDANPDVYHVDFTAGSGQETRWNNQTQLDPAHAITRDRAERDRTLLVYNGPRLDHDVEITGHPIVSLFLSSTETDGALHVYLEDVAPDGRVYYVTEGMLRLIHLARNPKAAPYEYPTPYRSFTQADSRPLTPGQIVNAEFDLYPISYLIRASHSVRLAIAGADADHFTLIPNRPPILTFYHDGKHPSQLILPVMPR